MRKKAVNGTYIDAASPRTKRDATLSYHRIGTSGKVRTSVDALLSSLGTLLPRQLRRQGVVVVRIRGSLFLTKFWWTHLKIYYKTLKKFGNKL